MVAANFPEALRFVRREEGGNDDDPQDHGGRTSRGVIQREWDAWRGMHPEKNLPADVWAAPDAEIDAIYQAQYWNPYGDRLPAGVDLEFFDFCVNAGRQQSVKTLQRALEVPADGMMGVVTWGAIEHADVDTLLRAFAKYREQFYRALKQFPRYGKGWLARSNRCLATAEKLITAPAKFPLGVSVTASPKANPAELRKPMVNPEAGAVTATATSGVLGTLSQLHDQLAPFAGTVRFIEYLLVAVTLAGFGFTVYGFWHRSQTAALAG